MGVLDGLVTALAGLGPVGMATALFLIFIVDAAIFPALPEVWLGVFYPALSGLWGDPLGAALYLLVFVLLGEAAGNALLYKLADLFFRHPRPWPRPLERFKRFLERVMTKWTQLLFLKDERIILLNRIAPVVPFTGAFIVVANWSFRKSMAYVVLGSALKYSFLLLLLGYFHIAYDRELAQLLTVVLIAVIVGMSVVASVLYKRKLREEAAARADPPAKD